MAPVYLSAFANIKLKWKPYTFKEEPTKHPLEVFSAEPFEPER